MIFALVLLPALAGLLAFALPKPALRRGVLIGTAIIHAALTAICWKFSPAPTLNEWLALDAAGLLFLSITSGLFLLASIYAAGYLSQEANRKFTDIEEGLLFDNAPEAVFIGCLLLFLSAMTLVTVSQHFGLLWVAIEGTTLASAPLIYFHRHHRSLEATWKYLLICSVGIALALLANFFLGVAAVNSSGENFPIVLPALLVHAHDLQTPWLKAACILFFVGYGTKMGLAPLHTWLPDAHSEAPSVISALLSGAVLNCAFLGLLRVQQIFVGAGMEQFTRDIWIALGVASLVISAIFIIGQTDYKRLLAYSSVENMGILALGIGLGAAGAFGALLHAINHSLVKAMLFLLAGNILARYQTKNISNVRGLLNATPVTGALWLAGFLAITGTPPFGPFLSKFTILKAALDLGHGYVVIATIFLATLGIIFVGMATAFLGMAQGEPEKVTIATNDSKWQIAPPLVLGAMVLWLGINVPEPLANLLKQIASTLGGAQ
ncbi:MAG TPA: proton-conducting transporter membrane subunit [Verrucomicrobiae bacterium]|nr:proton-conducting transporter membrane subunit [Verrucomicrobiae bacterium]